MKGKISDKKLPCSICPDKTFSSKHYLSQHTVIKYNRFMDNDMENGKEDSLENFSSNKETMVSFQARKSSCRSTNLSSPICPGEKVVNQNELPNALSNEKSTDPDKSKGKRSSNTIDFKLKVIDFLEELEASSQTTNKYKLVTKKFNIAKSRVSKWKEQKESLKKEAIKVSNKTTKTAFDSPKTARRNL